MDEPLTVRLFGSFEVRRKDLPIPGLHLREGERLLAFLLLRAPEPVATQEIARYFWPAEVQARVGEGGSGNFPSVRQALSALRISLGNKSDWLSRTSGRLIQLDTSGMVVDLLDFDRLVHTALLPTSVSGEDESGESGRRAVALYRGPLLADWNDTWVIEARRLRQRRYTFLLRQLVLRARESGQSGEEERLTRLLLQTAPGDEEITRGLLRLLSEAGRHGEAMTLVETLRETLAAENQIPSPDTLRLADELRQRRETARDGDKRVSPLPSPAVRPSIPVAHSEPALQEDRLVNIEPAGGAVPVGSRFYVERAPDALFRAALQRGDSVVLLKGARQVGKTSLLARGLQQARERGMKVVLTDFQKFNTAELATPDTFYKALATLIARKLGIPFSASDWEEDDAGPNLRMEQFLLGHVLPHFSEPLVWAIDEADRLFSCPFGGEVFGLFRSWHNERALDPTSEFHRLTLAISYATEAQLFIKDLNQSPFNVGTRLSLSDFTSAEIATLNMRYENTALSPSDLRLLEEIVGGQPYLLRCALNEVAVQQTPITVILTQAERDEGIFGDHLRRLWASLEQSPDLLPVLRSFAAGAETTLTPGEFYRLRAAGILAGHAPQEAAFRCRLYAQFFARQFGTPRAVNAG